MKKLMIVLCLLLIPAVSQAALCSGNHYQTFFITLLPGGGLVSGVMAFSEQNFNQGVISIEYNNMDEIGTGEYTSNFEFDIAGKFDFYDSNSKYYTFSFNGITTTITINGLGILTNPVTGKIYIGLFFGLLTSPS